ncbi:MAG: hypothetical protein IJI14_10415 [Anaerolineaceae bacterium]|nr:hypothetical protein [Anaerolineaceae bacterium]
MSKYIVISVSSEREIIEISQTDTLEAAQQLMLDDFKKVFCDWTNTEDQNFENEFLESKAAGDCEIFAMDAWFNCDMAFDWKIIEVHC